MLSNQSQNWAIRSVNMFRIILFILFLINFTSPLQCFRMDEKLSYKNLLSQFAPKGALSRIPSATPSQASSKHFPFPLYSSIDIDISLQVLNLLWF